MYIYLNYFIVIILSLFQNLSYKQFNLKATIDIKIFVSISNNITLLFANMCTKDMGQKDIISVLKLQISKVSASSV